MAQSPQGIKKLLEAEREANEIVEQAKKGKADQQLSVSLVLMC